MSVKKFALSLIIGTLLLSCSQKTQLLQSEDTTNIFSKNTKVTISKPEVIQMISPNQNERPEGTKISAIILHHTASAADAKSVGKFFATPESKVSSHYIIDRTGYLVQSVEDNFRSWHAGKSVFNGIENVNNFSIGIEICNIGDSKEPYPDSQYESIIRLVAYLVQTNNIPLANITRHRDIALPAGRKIDTSDNFSVKRVLDGVDKILKGEYEAPSPTPISPVNIPQFIEVNVKKGENTFKAIADIYLDNENRWKELQLVNPNVQNPDSIAIGTKIKIPTSYTYFYQVKNK